MNKPKTRGLQLPHTTTSNETLVHSVRQKNVNVEEVNLLKCFIDFPRLKILNSVCVAPHYVDNFIGLKVVTLEIH